jgi:3',5'-cyclic AMP phosphodiesterase CpdA
MTRLFHVSDLHFGRADQAAIDWFAATVHAEMPDAIICTGDLTMRARSREFEAAARYLESLPVPITIEPGNHDLPYFNLFDRFVRPYRSYGRVERMIERPLDLKNVVVVPLKTTARFQWRSNWSWGVVGRRSLDEAVARLGAAQPGDLKIIACHHPLVDKEGLESSAKTLRGKDAMQRLSVAGADLILSGHVHDPFDVEHLVAGRTIRKIGAGTLSERTRAHPPSFNELVIGPEGALQVRHRYMEPATASA